MKLVANIKLLPNAAQARALMATLERCNEACNWLSEVAFREKVFGQYNLQKLCYIELRSKFALTAQVAVRSIAKVADAYKLDKNVQRVFRKHSAQPYDDRIFRFKSDDVVSLWLLDGREAIACVAGAHQRELLKHRKGEVDLMFVRGKWYVSCVCDFDDPKLLTPDGVLGIDMGIVSLAVDSMGERHDGTEIEKISSDMFAAYTAGFFDGEGSISIGNPGRKHGYRLVVAISQNNITALLRIKERWGGGLGKGANKAMRLQFYSRGALSFLKDISPYLINKKHQADIAIRFQECKKNTGRSGTTDKQIAIEVTMKNDIEALNAERPVVTHPMFAHTCVPCVVESLAI